MKIDEEGAHGEEKISINNLSNDCLIAIFQILPLKEKFKLKLVCKRWNVLSKSSWNKVKTLDVNFIDKKYLKNDFYRQEYIYKTKNTQFVYQVLVRCKNYLNKILCDGLVNKVDWDIIMSANYFENLTEVELFNITVNDNHLRSLFEKNKQIKYITLSLIKGLNVSTLMYLNKNKIESFSIYSLENIPENVFANFLVGLKFIKKVKIIIINKNLNFIIDALNAGSINNLTELTLKRYTGIKTPLDKNKIKILFSNQKELHKLHLNSITKEIIDIISQHNIQEIGTSDGKIVEEYALINSLTSFNNLKAFIFNTEEWTDEKLENLSNGVSECQTLKVIYIKMRHCYFFESQPFTKLANIESLTLEIEIVNPLVKRKGFHSKNLLMSLSKCEQLKKIVF